jgi:riboflavin-specific deaminase-like protein
VACITVELLGSGPVEFRQLVPETRTVPIAELLSGLRLADRAPEDRPYTIVNFVASADGRATFAGRSGQLGDDGDHVLFHGLRSTVDAVMAGTGTLRTERYGRLISKADVREERQRAGRTAEPLACTVTRRADVPLDIPLFETPGARIVVFSPDELDLDGVRAEVEVVELDPGELTLVTVMRHLRTHHNVRSLLCEGGPTLFGSMIHEQVVDELFLTVAPKLTGGGAGPTVTSGPELPEPATLNLIWALERAGSLYLRYALS